MARSQKKFAKEFRTNRAATLKVNWPTLDSLLVHSGSQIENVSKLHRQLNQCNVMAS